MTPLEQLIHDAKQTVATQTAAKAATAKAKSAKSEDARSASQLEADRLHAELNWRPCAIVALVEQWTCACGSEGESPQGVYIFSEHRRLANATRLEPPRHESSVPEGLPHRIKYLPRTTALCPECMAEAGFTKIMLAEAPITGRPTIPAQHGFFVKQWLALRQPPKEVS